MAVQDPGLNIGWLVANVDLSAKQYLAVKVGTADNNVVLASTGGEAILGVLQNTPTANQAADVRFCGVSKGVAGGSYSRGTMLMTNTSGQFITATAGNHPCAYALEASAASGELHNILVIPTAVATFT